MEKENTVTVSSNKDKQSKFKVIVIIVIVALLCIGVGLYIWYFQNNKRIIGKALDNIKVSAEKYYLPEYDDIEEFDAYTSENNITLDIKSNYLTQMATYSPQLAPYTKLIGNLNKTTNKVVVKQDNNKEKAYFSLSSNLNNEEIFSMKYLVENNTEYYYIKGFLDNYINNGTSNYFESLNKDTTNKDNMKYVYEFAISSFKNNLKKEYFTKKGEKVEINGKEKTLQKVTLELDNDRMIEIAKAVLDDLKNDKKSNDILTGIDNDFKDAKIKSNKKIFNDDERMIFSVYVDNLTYAIKKYKLDFIDGSDVNTVTYERNEKGIFNLYENDQLKGKLIIDYQENETILSIYDEDNKNVGKVTISKKENMYNIIIKVEEENTAIQVSLNQKIKNIKKNSSYQAETAISLKATSNKVSLVDANIMVSSKVKKGASIDENTDNATFASDITSDRSQALQQQFNNVILKLMS